MRKTWKRSLACLLVAATLTLPVMASAHTHTGDATWSPKISNWAKPEVQKAKDLGLISGTILAKQDYRVPITRTEFRAMVMDFVAAQEHTSEGWLYYLVWDYMAQSDEKGKLKLLFTDGSNDDSLAGYLGLVEGRGNGIFDPNGLLTRQEAAVMLTRAYSVIGGQLPETAADMSFTDQASIADWAKDSASALAQWQVIRGMEDGTFAPKGHYTVEQCILTLLRLYESAPVTQAKGNVKQLFTYEQSLKVVDNFDSEGEGYHTKIRLEGPKAIFLRNDWSVVMSSGSSLWLMNREGGLYSLDIGLCGEEGVLRPEMTIQNAAFSPDGKTLTFSVNVPRNIIRETGRKLLHAKGTYQVIVDVDTGICHTQKV